jgi:hypothetical protein
VEIKSRIEQDHEQYPPFAIILPRGSAYAPLPQATKAGAKVRSHPVDVDALIRMRLLKEDQRQDVEALQTAVLGLLYRAEEDLP